MVADRQRPLQAICPSEPSLGVKQAVPAADLRAAVETRLEMSSAATSTEQQRSLDDTLDPISSDGDDDLHLPTDFGLVGKTIDQFTVTRIIGAALGLFIVQHQFHRKHRVRRADALLGQQQQHR
jgi:hypothetical protein